jgi:hypothetical protein
LACGRGSLYAPDKIGEDRFHAIVTIRTKDGIELRRDSVYRRMNEEDLDGKFLDLVSMRAGETKAGELAQVLKSLDRATNVADVMTSLQLTEAKIEDF